jgi:hypothetical protein
MLSAHVWLSPELDCAKAVADAATLGEEGLDLAIIYLPTPHAELRFPFRWRNALTSSFARKVSNSAQSDRIEVRNSSSRQRPLKAFR